MDCNQSYKPALKRKIPAAKLYKNNCSILNLTKGRCKFATSDFPSENPCSQNHTIQELC